MRIRFARWSLLAAALLATGCARSRTYEDVPQFQSFTRIELASDSVVRVEWPDISTLEGDSVVVRHGGTLERRAAYARADVRSVVASTPVSGGEVIAGGAILGFLVLVIALE